MKHILNRQELEDILRKYVHAKGWALLDCRISGFEFFQEIYGVAASKAVIRFTEKLIEEVIDEIGMPDDQLGSPENNNFVIITAEATMPKIREILKSRFNEEVLLYYSQSDRERGYLVLKDKNGKETHASLMSLAVGGVTADRRM